MTALLESLDPEQAQAVTAPPGPVCIIAGAGTGKTTALTGRIAYHVLAGAWEPEHVLAVTHSTRAAGNIRDRLVRVGGTRLSAVSARTFHSAAHSICREHWHLSGRPGPMQVADSAYPLVRAALRKRGHKDPSTALVQDLTAEIGWAKSNLLTPLTYAKAAAVASRTVTGATLAEAGKVLAEYEAALTASGRVDFTDLLTIAATIAAHPQAAAALADQYRHVLVDEFQDTDPAQYAFLHALLAGRDDITVVGDPRQAIYAFKGADSRLLAAFPREYPQTCVVTLVRDYRSTPQVASTANTLMRTPAAEAIIGCRAPGPDPQVLACASEDDEVTRVVRTIREHAAAGVPLSEISVLYRFNSQSAPFEEALAHASIPYQVLDKERFFDRPEVLDALRRAWEEMSRLEAAGTPATGVALLAGVLARTGFDPDAPPSGAGAARDRWEAQNALLDLASSRPDADRVTARDLLADLAERRKESHHVTASAVTLTTLHKAKGLEWESVILVRLTEGSLPSAYAVTDTLVAEEQRLAYVGITRAARLLTCTYATSRTSGKRTWSTTPSRFLAEAGLHPTRAASTPSRSARAARPAAAALNGPQQQVLTALLAWRAAEAARCRLPDFAVLSDEILRAVAASTASDRLGLLRVHGLGLAKVNAYGDSLLAALLAARR